MKNRPKMAVSNTSSMSSERQACDVQITLGELQQAVDSPALSEVLSRDVESISDSLDRLHVSGNMVRSAFAISTEGQKPKKPLLKLPKIHKKPYQAPKGECPISRALRKATEKHGERERYWKRRKFQYMQKLNPRFQQDRRTSLPRLDPFFSHRMQRYKDFETQESKKIVRQKAFYRITRKGRQSMIN